MSGADPDQAADTPDEAAGDGVGDLPEVDAATLRRRRAELIEREDGVSYARRIAQARVDLVRRRLADPETPLASELAEVLGRQALAPSGRPPRDTAAHDAALPARELDELCARHHFARVETLGGAALERLAEDLEAFEQRISGQRRELFAQIDALSDELVSRYRDGDANVDSLWTDET